MKLKRALTSIYVVLINYYLLVFIVGILMMLASVFLGPLNIFVLLAGTILPLVACITYQIKRSHWTYDSIGEIIVANNQKKDILDQSKTFSITRIPIFLLVLIILIANGNLLDGLGSGHVYTLVNVLLFSIIFLTTYNGLRNFFLKQDILSIMVFAGGLLYAAFAFRKTVLYELYYGFTIVWLLVSLVYKWKVIRIKEAESKA